MKKYIVILYMFLISSSFAETIIFESGNQRNTLIELYTSEGCSSCPPAEKYLNSLKNNNEIWKKIIPIAFHVDYWDYIGWKDQYAQKEFGQRQSFYARLKRASTVYTPAFMVNGNSWRKGIFSNPLPMDNSSVGKLVVRMNDSHIETKYYPINKNNVSLKINVAILGMNLISKIERGENAGRIASHDFVVVGFNDLASDNLTWNMKIPDLHYFKSKKYALAVWVSEENNPTPLQVVGGELTNYKP